MNGLVQKVMLSSVLLLVCAAPWAQESSWPRTVPVDSGLVTIYPLQAEAQDGDVVRYRAALAWRAKADAEPVFGAGWFESAVTIDQKSRVVHPRDLKVTRLRFPEDTADLQPGLAAILAKESPGWNLDYSLDELNSDLADAAAERSSLQNLNTEPPAIVYRDHPALLVTLDGDPVLRAIENSELQAVINTPYPLIYDGHRYYLNAMNGVWYSADRATGPYRYEAKPPAAVAAMVKPDETAAQAAPAEPVTAANAPEIVVATQPTELVVTDGPAVFVPLVDDLLVLQNSDDDLFMHVSSQQYYIVLAGRWYRSGSLNGPWTYQAADQLPPAFTEIPPGSAQGDSRVYVAGTPEAEEAVLDAQLPQTAAVERGTADVEVVYDGQPDFRPVDGTDMQYAANTGSAVLRSDRQYYLVEDGVWYVSDSPNGPWVVSAWRPQSVARIAPTSPVYNVKYVYIYDYTPSVVYVGYTPGYLGSYVYYDTVVFGTGWYYRPWVSPYYYYPRASTWGFHVGYNPWYGWSFGLSWNWGWGWGWSPWYASYWTGGYWSQPYYWHDRYYGYWGPRGYRPRPVPYNYRGHGGDRYAHGGRPPPQADYRGNKRGDPRDYARNPDGDRYSDRNAYRGRNDNLYRDAGQRARVVNTRDNPRRNWQGSGASPAGDYARNPGNRGGQGPDSRATPVSPNELRYKAQVRDANRAAVRSPMVVDSSGKVRSKERVRQQLHATPGTLAGTQAGPQAAPRDQAVAAQARSPGKPTRSRDVQSSRTVPTQAVRAPQRKQRQVADSRDLAQPRQAAAQREARAPERPTQGSNRQRVVAPVPDMRADARARTVPQSRAQAATAPTRQAPAPSREARPAAPPPVQMPSRTQAPAMDRAPARQSAPQAAQQFPAPSAPAPQAAPSRSQSHAGAAPRSDGPRGGGRDRSRSQKRHDR